MSQFLFITPEEHFSEAFKEAQSAHKVKPNPALDHYIVRLLTHYLTSQNLFNPIVSQFETADAPPETLAELYLTAINSEGVKKIELMKVMAEKSLYLTGFFSESLNSKLIDKDYFCEMGKKGYFTLSHLTRESELQTVYSTLSNRFNEYVLVLNYMSEKSAIQAETNIIHLYEKYVQTGSEIAREKLTQLGVTTPSKEQLKVNKA